jgi:drug/metabolite transporter (DMT)-like permease
MVATVPMWMALIAVVVFHERIRAASVGALALGLIGLVVLIAASGRLGGEAPIPALLLALGGAAAWAAGSMYTRDAPMPSDPILAAGMQMLIGGALLGIAATVTGEVGDLDPTSVTGESLVWLFYLAVPNALSFGAYIWLLRVAPPVLVSSYAYLSPIVALLLGWAVLSEPITGLMLTGAGLVVVSVVVLVTPAKRLTPGLSAFSPVPALRWLRHRGTRKADE